MLVAHAIAFDGLALHGAPALAFGLKWALAFLCVGLFEEFLTRGYLQYTLARGISGLTRFIAPTSRHAHAIGFWVAAFLFSVCLFMSGHIGNPGETLPGILAVGLAGAVFAFSLYRTGTLWWAIGMHAAWDWAQTFFYGVSDSGIAATGHLLGSHPTGRTLLSGGSTGPEGSLLVLPTLLLLAAHHPPNPSQAATTPLPPPKHPNPTSNTYQPTATQLKADSSKLSQRLPHPLTFTLDPAWTHNPNRASSPVAPHPDDAPDSPGIKPSATRTPRPTPEWRTPRRLRQATLLFVVLVLILGAMGWFGARIWVRSTARAALPQLDGTLAVQGLTAPVTIARDEHGVPHIHAASIDDLVFAQAFVTTGDRLFQMDLLRRHAAGELAAILGPTLLPHDRLQRTLQIRAAADRAVAQLPPDQLHLLEVYARGVNASIAAQSPHLPLEFHILGYQPAPWTPRDSLLVSLAMFQDLTNQYPTKLAREALSARLPADLIADLYPTGSWRDHPPTTPEPDLTIEGPP